MMESPQTRPLSADLSPSPPDDRNLVGPSWLLLEESPRQTLGVEGVGDSFDDKYTTKVESDGAVTCEPSLWGGPWRRRTRRASRFRTWQGPASQWTAAFRGRAFPCGARRLPACAEQVGGPESRERGGKKRKRRAESVSTSRSFAFSCWFLARTLSDWSRRILLSWRSLALFSINIFCCFIVSTIEADWLVRPVPI